MRYGFFVAVCFSLMGCGVESQFDMASTDLPPGLVNDPRLMGATISQIEIVFYTNEPVTVMVFDSSGKKCLVEQGSWRKMEDDESHALFFMTFNGVERLYERYAPGKLRELPDT